MHNEELHDLKFSSNIMWEINSRRLIWTIHVARMTNEKFTQLYGRKNLKERDHFEDVGIDISE
jgi:Holliday junction resolvasome RuvABC DNA-binding subunit